MTELRDIVDRFILKKQSETSDGYPETVGFLQCFLGYAIGNLDKDRQEQILQIMEDITNGK